MTRILQTQGVFTLINTFTVIDGHQQDVIDSLVDVTKRVTATLPGFLSATIHRGQDGQHVANYVQWQTVEHFHAAFKHPEMQKHMADLHRLVQQVLPLTYTIPYSRSAEDGAE